MCATFNGVYIVNKRIYVFVVSVVIGKRDFDGNTLTLGVKMDYIVDEGFLV